jgi:hypothetical protein
MIVLLRLDDAISAENKKGGIKPADPCGYVWDEMQSRKEYGV